MHSRFHCKILSIAPKSSQERGEDRAKVNMFVCARRVARRHLRCFQTAIGSKQASTTMTV